MKKIIEALKTIQVIRSGSKKDNWSYTQVQYRQVYVNVTRICIACKLLVMTQLFMHFV